VKKILGTLVVALLLGAPVLAQPVIVGDPASAGFGATASGTGNYMWFNVLLANTGSGSPSAIGGVSLAAMVGGPWAAAHLSMPPNYGPGGVNSENRYSGIQMANFLGASASNYAFGTAITTSCDYPTSTSGYFTPSTGNYLTYGIDNQSSVVTPVSNGMILARLYFAWDGTPLGANSVSVSLIAESGNPALGPSIFAAGSSTTTIGGNTYTVIGPEVFSAPSTFTITAPAGTLSITAYTSTTWVYQNTPVTTQDRHQISLTVSATDTWPNNTYTVTIAQTGPGVVTPTRTWIAGTTLTPTGLAPVVWTVPASTTFSGYLVGGRVSGTVNGAPNIKLTGSCALTITVQGDQSGPANLATAQATITVRPLGAISGGSTVSPTNDKKWLNGRLNGQAPYTSYDSNIYNLDGHSGATSPNQKTKVLNLVLNGTIVP